jgi:ABC-type amino acid transport substrate-binding protein
MPMQSHACELKASKAILANYIWLAEDYPPYSYKNNAGELVGIFTDILSLIYQELNIELNVDNIQIVPWPRLYYSLEKESKYAAFSMSGTPERAKKFALIPIPLTSKISLLVLNKNKDKLKNTPLDNLTIAVVREDIGQLLLNELDFPAKQIETSSSSSILKMLFHQRVDAIAYSDNVAYFQYDKLGFTDDTLTPLYILDEASSTNYVFNKNTSACVLNLFSNTINELRMKGKLKPIKNKYLANRLN